MERSNQSIEVELITQAIYLKYGYDFRDYSRAAIQRRLLLRLEKEGLANLSALLHRLLYEPRFFAQILGDFSINVTEMFRDPAFYLSLKTKVLPELGQRPQLKVWHAGCGSGEEVYSLAILFKEAGLYDRTQFYATDINRTVLDKARNGEIPIRELKNYSANYLRAGGETSLTDHLLLQAGTARIRPDLLANILFSDHNLAHDQVFGEMDLILCRNVLIYFNQKLQNKVLQLFRDSLRPGGFLGLGMKEDLSFADSRNDFTPLPDKVHLYQRKQ